METGRVNRIICMQTLKPHKYRYMFIFHSTIASCIYVAFVFILKRIIHNHTAISLYFSKMTLSFVRVQPL